MVPGDSAGRCVPRCCAQGVPHMVVMSSCLEAASLAPWSPRCWHRGPRIASVAEPTSLPPQTLHCWHRGPCVRATTAPAGLAAQQQRARSCRLPALPGLLLPEARQELAGIAHAQAQLSLQPNAQGKVAAFMTGQGHSLEFWVTNSGTTVLMGKAAIKPQPL